MISKKDTEARNSVAAKVEALRDLSDFCQHWPELRGFLNVDQLTSSEDIELERAIVKWLVLLADRVCLSEDF